MFENRPTATLVEAAASDDMVAMAAWVSTGQAKEERLENRSQVSGLINFLIKNRHMSPVEHGHFTFMIDCPIFVAREFHRHRTMSYNEVSGRYSKMVGCFHLPPVERPLFQVGKIGHYTFVEGTKEDHEYLIKQLVRAYDASWEVYTDLLDKGYAKEVARDCLPVGLYTQFYATVNPRNLMQFLDLRTAPDALYEIRQVADDMEQAFKESMPITYNAWKDNKTDHKAYRDYLLERK